MEILVVDYGMGNLRSVSKAFEKLGFDVVVSSEPADLKRASKLVVPGVGAFRDAIEELRRRRLIEPIMKCIEREVPYLGICLGYQLLFEESTEGGRWNGMGVVKGKVVRFPLSFKEKGLKVPHIGWNRAWFKRPSPLFEGIESGSYFYFVHSYYPEPEENAVIAETEYGLRFASAVQKGSLFATQFHPEKSQELGLRVIRNFAIYEPR